MFTIFFLAIFNSANVINAGALNNDSCVPYTYQYNPCYATVAFDFQCPTSTLDLGQYQNLTACSSVELFWSYPMNNFTIVFQTLWTEQHQPYTIRLQARSLKPQIRHLYRINEGVEKEVKIRGKVIREKSDKNYQVILKFQAPKRLQFYGVFIEYNVVKN